MKVCIIAKPPLRVARINVATGEPLSTRPVGYDVNGVAFLNGEVLDDHAHYRRAARRGECELVEVDNTTTHAAVNSDG